MKKEQSKAKVKVNISKPLVMEGLLTAEAVGQLWREYKDWREYNGLLNYDLTAEGFMDWLSERKDER